ncbi:hypothetical protein E3N88_06353 [Mikania micrantha]|uniref:HRDC domain-containing protein n=1 Tax=Mikania micrantha TaxID=192012 RepID=A0A5N6PQL2_9ASTR|nr:hypothetical protein E3N88_06353 [Mikania micrantha]
MGTEEKGKAQERIRRTKPIAHLYHDRFRSRFPCATKASKSSRNNTSTPTNGLLTSSKQSPLHVDTPAQTQTEVDLNLYAKLYAALRILRTVLVKEAGEGVMAYHIFGNATLQHISKRIPRTKEELLEINSIGKAKVSKYGDKVLETIETTLNEYYNYNTNNHSSSRLNRNSMDDFDFVARPDCSKDGMSMEPDTITAPSVVYHLDYEDEHNDDGHLNLENIHQHDG